MFREGVIKHYEKKALELLKHEGGDENADFDAEYWKRFGDEGANKYLKQYWSKKAGTKSFQEAYLRGMEDEMIHSEAGEHMSVYGLEHNEDGSTRVVRYEGDNIVEIDQSSPEARATVEMRSALERFATKNPDGTYQMTKIVGVEDIYLLFVMVMTIVLITRNHSPRRQKAAAMTFVLFPIVEYVLNGNFGNSGQYGMMLMSLIVMYCIIFNDGAHRNLSDPAVRADRTIVLPHGEKMLFGKESDGLFLVSLHHVLRKFCQQVIKLACKGILAELIDRVDYYLGRKRLALKD